jgi:hypothetical protein
MTSEERREARYRRRKAKRDEQRFARSKACGTMDEVFSFRHLYLSGKKSAKNVRWKASTQKYLSNLIVNSARSRQAILDGTFRHGKFYCFDLVERGKLRHIRSVHITERVVQKCLCDYCIVPSFSGAFIYDNTASLQNRGMDFALRRFERHLKEYYRKHGRDGWVLFYDFHDYFNLAAHEPLFAESKRRLYYDDVRRLSDGFISDFHDCGLGLGSQVSQTNALLLPSALDHFCKEQLGIRGYGRYMDDGHLIHESREYLEYCYRMLTEKAAESKIELNHKKTKIVPLRRGVFFLKTKFTLDENGRVYIRMRRRATIIMRRKLRKFKGRIADGLMTYDDLRCAYNSYLGHMKRGDSFRIMEQTNQYFKTLFGFYPNRKGWETVCTK